MAKVCLVRPPSIVSAGSYIGSLTPPIGLAYLAGSLRAEGHEVIIIDSVGLAPLQNTYLGTALILRGLGFEDIVMRIPQDADLIGFSGMFSAEWVSMRSLVKLIGESFPDTLFVAGGEHFTAAPEMCLNQCAALDAIVMGEGEETIVDLANAIDHHLPWELIPGLTIRIGNKPVRTEVRKRIRVLDDIPKPAWDLVPVEVYLDLGLSYGVNRGRSMPMIASRGCPYQCTFCSSPAMWGTRWLSRDFRKVVDEIEEYIQRYSITNVDFYDLTAIVKKDWIVNFCKELIKRDLNITWQLPSGTRSEAIDAEVTPLLFQSGCRNMNYAPESGSKKTLIEIKKKVKIPRMIESLRAAVKDGINVKINIIIGFPNENHADILKTMWLLLRFSAAGAHDVSIGVFAPYPGSELYRELVKSERIQHDDEYWQKLAYVDISETVSYSNHVTAGWLRFYNWAGFAIFYLSNYFFRPSRLWRTALNLATSRHESRGEMALAQIFSRLLFIFRRQ